MTVHSEKNKLHPTLITSPKITCKSYPPVQKKDNDIIFGHHTRYVVLGLSTLCLSLVMSNSLALNFTIICMTKESDALPNSTLNSQTSSVTLSSKNGLSSEKDELGQNFQPKSKYSYSRTEETALFSSIAFGTLLGTLPITYIDSKFGLRRTFTAYGLISALSTLLTPFCAFLGFLPLLFMRFFTGSIITHWSTLRNSGMYIALLSCHLQFGPIFTMPISGSLCESRFGWTSVFYLQGMLTLIAFFAFYMFFRNSPKFHRHVSSKELKTIEKNKNLDSDNSKQKVPYLAIAKDVAVWGVFISNVGGNFGFLIFMHYGPTYLNKALKFNVQSTGFAAALPYVFSALIKFIVGPFSDHFTFVSAKTRVIIFATVSQFSMSFCFIALAFLPPTYPTVIQTCFTLCTVFSGLNCVGVAKSTQLMSRQFAHVLMAMNAVIASCIVLLIPVLVSVLVPNNTVEEWSRIFILIAVVCIIATIIFDLTAQVDPRPWTYANSSSGETLSKSLTNPENALEQSKDKLFTIHIDSFDSDTNKFDLK